MEQFIGKEKIALVVEVEGKKSPSGEMLVEVTFESGAKEVMTNKRLEAISSLEPVESFVPALRKIVGATLFGVLNEFGVKMGEINTCADAMVELANNGFNKSSGILFGSEYLQVSLTRINDILVENMKKENGTDQTA